MLCVCLPVGLAAPTQAVPTRVSCDLLSLYLVDLFTVSDDCYKLFELFDAVENGRILIVTLLIIYSRTSQEFDFLN